MPGVLQNQTKQATAPMIPCRPANKTTSNWSSVESHCRCQLAASAQLKTTAMPNSNTSAMIVDIDDIDDDDHGL